MVRLRKQILYGALVVLLGALATVTLVMSRKEPERKALVSPGPLVETMIATKEDVQILVAGQGTVQPEVSVQIVPQVSGKVVQVHRSLVNGGFFRKGEPLLTIDPTDYELAEQKAAAELARAEVALELEKAEAEIARQDWEQIHPGQEPASTLVFRQPQVARAVSEVKAAQASLDSARVSLERTRVTVPFDGRVISEHVDPGQFVVAGQPLATVYGTDSVEIPLPLEDAELAWIEVPGMTLSRNAEGLRTGARVLLSATFAGSRHTWEGRIVRTEGEIDPVTRMVHVVVSVPRPFDAYQGRPPLTPGMFVEALVQGKVLENIFQVPRHALRDDETIWTVVDGQLRFRKVAVARRERDRVFVSSGIQEGDQIVTSSIESVTDGMTVRVVPQQQRAERASELKPSALSEVNDE